MTVSLIDELDATFLEVDQLTEQWEQAQAYASALTRIHYLTPAFVALVEEIKHARVSLPSSTWSRLRTTLIRERPAELEVIGRALTAGDEQFMRLIRYVGFVHGALVAVGELAQICEPAPDIDYKSSGLVDILEAKEQKGGETEAIEVVGHPKQERLALVRRR